MMRKPLIVLLGLGVLVGYGSALGHMRHRWHGGHGEGDCGSYGRWSERYDAPAPAPVVAAPAPAPAPAPVQQAPVIPQIIIVQPQNAPAAPAPTVIFQPAPQAPAPSPAPKAEQPAAKPTSAE